MAENETQPTLTPDEALAATITEAIGAANLVNAQKLPRIREGLTEEPHESRLEAPGELGSTTKEGADTK